MRSLLRPFAALLPLLLTLLAAAPSPAKDLDVDLSKPDVRLNVSFKGSDLLLFGAKTKPADVIVVVRGPGRDTSMRRKERMAGIWVNTDEVVFADAPAFYAVAASRPIEDLLPKATLAKEKIGTTRLGLKAKSAPDGAKAEDVQKFADGLLRNMERHNLYTAEPGQVNMVGNHLFRTNLWFPSNVAVGDYLIDTYMINEGRITSKETTKLRVHKVGIEAQLYDFAHEHALIYGLLAVIIAVVSGWAANAVFKKRG